MCIYIYIHTARGRAARPWLLVVGAQAVLRVVRVLPPSA